MRRLTSIVAINEEGAIGSGNALPWRVRSDLRFFRQQTADNVVIMGRRTFKSLGDRGLPNRKNVIVTHGCSLFGSSEECEAVGSIEEALVRAEKWRTDSQDVFVIGGASMYKQFALYVDRYLITEIKKPAPDADTFLSETIRHDLRDWRRTVISSGKADGMHDEADFTICEYVNADGSLAAARRERVCDEYFARRHSNRLMCATQPQAITI